MINQNTDWWKNYASENGLDPNTGKKSSGGGNWDDATAIAEFESTLHSESNHDAVMRDMYGSYNQYVAEKIENSSLSESQMATLISKYGIQESDLNRKK